MLKENKGVTLVALVITIIVLLILAGVTLSMVMGNGGIFTKANNASEQTNVASAKDAVRLATLEAVSDQYNNDGSYGTELTDSTVVGAVNNKLQDGYSIATGNAGADLAISKDGKDTGVTVNFTVKSRAVTPTFNK